ncbi:MAG: nucleotidyltransferase family protein [Ignavibacteriae bacterium]|nr:nucleotidyltransferase family protein [Ignavibacteriota bacterium]
MLNKEQIKSRTIPILRKNGVKKAALFGSVVRGENTDQSDVDFLVEFQEGKSLFDLVGLQLDLNELLGMDVDVVTYNGVHIRLRDAILDEQEIFYQEAPGNLS